MDCVELAKKTSNAYSADRYGCYWERCAELLIRSGFSMKEAEQQLRSKNMRWAADDALTESETSRFVSFAVMVAKNLSQMKAEAEKWVIESESEELITRNTMKPSEQCKAAGLKSLNELSEASKVSQMTLVNWSKNRPDVFRLLIAGVVAEKTKCV